MWSHFCVFGVLRKCEIELEFFCTMQKKTPRVKSYKIHFMGPETKFNIHMRPIQKKMVHHTDMWSESKMHKNLEKSSNVPKILAKMKNNFLKRIYVCMRK